MINRLLFLVLAMAQVNVFAQTADYAAAEKYDAPKLAKLTSNLSIIPFFISNTDKFWYVADVNGESNYFLFNPEKNEKILLYNKSILKQQLASIVEQKVDDRSLHLNPAFDSSITAVKFQYQSQSYYYNFYTKTITKDTDLVKKIVTDARIVGNASPNKQWQLYTKTHNLFLNKIGIGNDVALSKDAAPYYSFCINENDTSTSRIVSSNAHWLANARWFYVIRKDNRKVRTLSVMHTITPNPWLETYKYQLPGDKDVTQYELFIGDTLTQKMVKIDIGKWKDQTIEVIPAPTNATELFFLRKRRTLDEQELCAVNLETGNVRVVISETAKPHFNYELFAVHILNAGKDIVWWSDKTGWGQYYWYDGNGNLKNQITHGNNTAGKINKIDTSNKLIYYYAYGKAAVKNPYLANLYKCSFDGTNDTRLTPEDAMHNVFISPSKKYFVDNFSRIDAAPQIVVRNNNGKLITELLKPDISRLLSYGWKMPEPFVVKAKDGVTDLYGIMWKPYNFDSTKKYPIISQVYPGPFIETVWPDFTVIDKYNNTALAQVGFIVVVMGHRGSSPLRGKAYYNYGYGNLRDFALEDDKYGLEQLAASYKFIDLNRLGIIGHSGGAAMATAAICTYPDFYKVAVASSGNHDNTLYNLNWGESYQGIQVQNDTLKSGEITSRLKFKIPVNQSLAKNLKGHLLLVTGEVDANVHPGNTYRMVDALVNAGKDFDMLVMPNQSHHYEGVYKTFFENKVRHYFAKYLIEEFH